MITKNIFLKIYLKQVEKAHSIMNFLYTIETKKNILKKIRALESFKSKNTASEYMVLLYKSFCESKMPIRHKSTFFEIIKEAQKKLGKIPE